MLKLTPDTVLSGLDVDKLPPSQIEIDYDPLSGQLSLTGDRDLVLDALFLRISDDVGGNAADFGFQLGMAPWSVNPDIVLSDTAEAQSFIDHRSDPTFLFAVGDRFQSMLPAGLPSESISDHLSAAYRIHGSPVRWSANAATIPEPCSWLLLALGIVALPGRASRS